MVLTESKLFPRLAFDSLDSPIFPIATMVKIQLDFKRNTNVFDELRSLGAKF